MAERFNAPVLKTGVGFPYRGFESLPIRFFFLRNRCLSRFVFLGSGIHFVTGLLAQLRLRYRAARAAPLVLLGRLRRNQSGAAQAARCLTYPVQFHLNVEQLAPMTLSCSGNARIGANWPQRHRAARAAPLVLLGRLRPQSKRCGASPIPFT